MWGGGLQMWLIVSPEDKVNYTVREIHDISAAHFELAAHQWGSPIESIYPSRGVIEFNRIFATHGSRE